MKYLRTFPLFLQVFLFLSLAYTLSQFTSAITQYFIPVLSGHTVREVVGANESSSGYLMRVRTFAGVAMTAGLFLLPALLFAYLTHPQPMAYLGLRRPARPAQWLAVLVLTAGMIPVLSGLQELVQQLPLPAHIRAGQAANNAFNTRLVREAPPATFLALLAFIAGLTALQEELFFRGVLTRMAYKISRGRMTLAILLPAVLFAAQHLNQPEALASIFVAGVALALVYALTGSLWLSIWMHFLFNGTQLMMLRFGNPDSPEHATPWLLIAGGMALFAGGWYWLYRLRTPLPPNWAADYAPGEQPDAGGPSRSI